MRPRLLVSLAVAFLLALLSGCGGDGGGGGGGGISNATFRIYWPERTKSVIDHQLTSALSARVLLKKASTSGKDITVDVDRESGTAAYFGTYTVHQSIRADVAQMTATFYSQAGEHGAIVGTATANVSISGTQLEFASIVVDGTIKTVAVAPPVSIDHNAGPTQLQVAAKDASNATVAVSVGSARWTLLSGYAGTLTADGVLTPIKGGTLSIKVTIDGVTSAPTTVTVTDPNSPTTMIVNVPTNDIVWDPTRNLLWGTVQKSGGANANCLVTINPTTGAVGSRIPVGIEPNLIAVTDNGKYAYITSTEDQKVRRVDLTEGVVKLTVITGQDYQQLIAVPGSPNSFAVATDPFGGVNVSIYDDSVRRSGTGAGGDCIRFGATNTRLYGVGGNEMYRNTLTPTSINWDDHTFGLANGDFEYSNGLIYTVHGEVVKPETYEGVGQMSTVHFHFDRRITVNEADNRVYMVTWPTTEGKQLLSFDKSTLAEKTPYDIDPTPGGAMHLVPAGPHAVAFHLYGDVTRQVVIIHNLP